MSDEIHPLSRREGPAPARSGEPADRPRVPLDTSLPDVCTYEKRCFARHVRSEGGMGSLLWGLAFQWGAVAALGTAGFITLGPLFALILTVPASLFLTGGLVAYRVQGHRGWCWVLRSLNLGETGSSAQDALMGFLFLVLDRLLRLVIWLLRPFRRAWRAFAGFCGRLFR
ncbi:hypothetical protein [Planomonospora alba]